MNLDVKRTIFYASWILAFEAVSMVIGHLTQSGVDGWYAELARPPLVPPNLLFPIMWTILYALIAVAGCRLWETRHSIIHAPLRSLFVIYMLMNWGWSFIFFSAHALMPALAWIVGVNIVALSLICAAWRVERIVAKLMIPVTLWTLFAAYLTGGYWYLNGFGL